LFSVARNAEIRSICLKSHSYSWCMHTIENTFKSIRLLKFLEHSTADRKVQPF
jgi:hypothetical protein